MKFRRQRNLSNRSKPIAHNQNIQVKKIEAVCASDRSKNSVFKSREFNGCKENANATPDLVRQAQDQGRILRLGPKAVELDGLDLGAGHWQHEQRRKAGVRQPAARLDFGFESNVRAVEEQVGPRPC